MAQSGILSVSTAAIVTLMSCLQSRSPHIRCLCHKAKFEILFPAVLFAISLDVFTDYGACLRGVEVIRSRATKRTKDTDRRIKEAWDQLKMGQITAEELIQRVKFPEELSGIDEVFDVDPYDIHSPAHSDDTLTASEGEMETEVHHGDLPAEWNK